jgi:dihydropteroate synthase
MTLRLPRGRSLSFGRMPLVMGIVNVTPDSFSDGGVHFDHAKAVHAALQMEEDGAAVIDVGGESSRPGSEPVDEQTELERVLPVIAQIRARSDVPLSIDTTKAGVAEAAINAGADVINDISALRFDPAMRPLAARTGVPVVLMHMRGDPKTMQEDIHFDDVVSEVARELAQRRDAAIAAGIDSEQIVVDPGIGFGKTGEHNLQILAKANELTSIAPLLIGASRKAFIGRLTGRSAGAGRAAGSLATIVAAYEAGAAIVRVHDVRETVDALKVWRAIEGASR